MAAKRLHLEDPRQSIQSLLRMLLERERKLVVGIDPGKSGAIAFLPVGPRMKPLLVDIPVDEIERFTSRPVKTSKTAGKTAGKKAKRKKVKGKQKQYDMNTIAALFDPVIDFNNDGGELMVALERTQPMPRDTAVTAFQMGLGYGMWHLFFTAFGLPYMELQPASWKRKMGLLKQGKDAGRIKAKKLFPSVVDYLAFVGDHDRAEALLIAEVARREWEGD